MQSSANDYCSLNHDTLWLCSGIELVRSAVKPNSAETCPVEAQRKCMGKQNEVVGAGVAHNATYMEKRHVRHQPVDAYTTPPPRTNTATRKRCDRDSKCMTSANRVRDD